MRTVILTLGFVLTISIIGSRWTETNFIDAKEVKIQEAKVPLFEGTGEYRRKVTTTSDDAQKYFDQGLNFLFAFNHDEAIRSFQQALVHDPSCAMAYWGIAFANGPHINNTAVSPEKAKAAWEAVTKAQELAKTGTDVEKAFIDAIAKRYASEEPKDRVPLNEAFAKSMREVWKQFPKDPEVGAFFAESMMNLRPWDLYTQDKKPQPGTDEIVETLEKVMELSSRHPLALHLYIHAVEASSSPERAEKPADRLRDVCPGLGHLVHMPTHIDVVLGHWEKAIDSNQKAIDADVKYHKLVPKQGFYRLYMAHNHHMLCFAAMMTGKSKRAFEVTQEMFNQVPKEWTEDPKNAAILDGFVAMPIELMMRFGRWDDLLKQPEPPERFPIARAIRHFGRGVTYMALNKIELAKEAQKAFREAMTKPAKEATFGNNKASDLLAVADDLLAGEILFKEGKTEEGLELMRKASEKESKLRYSEPPDWINPVPHALGAALLKAGKPEEAEKVYRADLKKWPNNGWSLFGLAKSLEALGKKTEAEEVHKQFEKIWKDADVKLMASCFCQNPDR